MAHAVLFTTAAKRSLKALSANQRRIVDDLASTLVHGPQRKGRAIHGEPRRRVISRGGYRVAYEYDVAKKQVSVLSLTVSLESLVGDRLSVWELPRFKVLLGQPLGTPISLTREEAIAIIQEGFASRPDLPSGSEYVRQAKLMWRGLVRPRRRD